MIGKKTRITFNQIKEFLLKRGFVVKKKSDKKLLNNDFKPLYYTFLSSLALILIFFLIPTIVEFKKNTTIASKEIENNSKTNFEKVLDKKNLKKFESTDEGLGTEYFEDILDDDVPDDTVRFSAQEIEKLFRETDYNLTNVRKTKLVQPFPIAHLPKEMKIIKLSSDQRTFSWGSNDRKLMNVPFDEHPYSALAAWFKTDEGMEIYSNIEKRLK